MLPTRREIDTLVDKVSRCPLERNAALQLTHALLDPLVPSILAEKLEQNPTLLQGDRILPRHLAFGVVDTGLEFRSEQERVRITKKLFRRLDRVEVVLLQNDESTNISHAVCAPFWELYRGYLALEELSADRDLKNGELSSLVEEFIDVLSRQASLLILLMQHRLKLWNNPRRAVLFKRVLHTVKEGLKNEPVDETIVVYDLSEPIRFRHSHLSDPDFLEVADTVESLLAEGARQPQR